MEQKEDTIIDAETYRKSEVFGFRELFLAQVRRCIDKQSQEMKEGFWVYTNIPGQLQQRTKYVGDSRSEFSNSVKALHDLAQPKFDVDMKSRAKEINERINKKHKEVVEEQEKTQQGMREEWMKAEVKLYREMFQALCFFGNRMNWFESGVGEE